MENWNIEKIRPYTLSVKVLNVKHYTWISKEICCILNADIKFDAFAMFYVLLATTSRTY